MVYILVGNTVAVLFVFIAIFFNSAFAGDAREARISRPDYIPGDGDRVHVDWAGPGTTRTHIGRGSSNGTTYFYTAFAYDTSHNFATTVPLPQALATPGLRPLR